MWKWNGIKSNYKNENREDIPVSIHHTSIGAAKTEASSYDVVFCSDALKGNFDKAKASGTIVIGLKNLLSEKEIEEKIVENIVNK